MDLGIIVDGYIKNSNLHFLIKFRPAAASSIFYRLKGRTGIDY